MNLIKLFLINKKHLDNIIYNCNGGLAERSNAAVLKTALRETVTGVRIPEPPQNTRVAEIEIIVHDYR